MHSNHSNDYAVVDVHCVSQTCPYLISAREGKYFESQNRLSEPVHYEIERLDKLLTNSSVFVVETLLDNSGLIYSPLAVK